MLEMESIGLSAICRLRLFPPMSLLLQVSRSYDLDEKFIDIYLDEDNQQQKELFHCQINQLCLRRQLSCWESFANIYRVERQQ